jgi:hypothetical protein
MCPAVARVLGARVRRYDTDVEGFALRAIGVVGFLALRGRGGRMSLRRGSTGSQACEARAEIT